MLLGKKRYRNLNTLHVFKDALKHNLHLYQRLCPEQTVCPVLKSNAYGHGLTLVAKVLDQEEAPFFIVDSLYEAYELKKAQIKTPILIIGASHPDNLRGRKLPFHFAAFNEENAELFAKMRVSVHIKVDTGFNRMGFSLQQLKNNLPTFKKWGLKVEGIYTHFADADNPSSNRKDDEQVQIFNEAVELVRSAGFTPKWIHAANSAGALKAQESPLNLTRLGFALYGISPLEDNDPFAKKLETLEPALELESTLVSIREIEKGEEVGYNCTFTAPRAMKVGVVPVGYYEALPRSLSNKGFMEVNGEMCPIIGRVCMNMTIIDLTGVEASLYDPVIVYSRDPDKKNSVKNLAKLADVSPYEMLVRISASVARRAQ